MGKKERNDRTIIESSDEYSANDGRRRTATVLPADATGTTAVPTGSGSISATTTILVFFTTRCVGVSARGCESDGGGAAASGGTAATILRPAATSGERERVHTTVLVRRFRRRVGGDCPEIFSREEARHAVDDDATDDEAVYESSGRDAGGDAGDAGWWGRVPAISGNATTTAAAKTGGDDAKVYGYDGDAGDDAAAEF